MLLCCMKTIKDVFLSFHNALKDLYDGRETESIALLVLEEITGLSRAKIKAFGGDDVPADAADKIAGILEQLKTGKPVQYILGNTEFFGLSFLVNSSTLIPRPETEELVEWVLQTQKVNYNQKRVSILDIGTGSGCIAISLKKKLPDAQVTSVDISADALHTATQNAIINDVEVEFIVDDILSIKSKITDRKYNIIISNPPYVTLKDKLLMHQNVTDFEPHTALFVPEDNPLIFYKAIADFAIEHLEIGGSLFLEINESFGKETIQMLHNKGFSEIELRKDMSGRDRMIKAVKLI
jgi:release factor glutamine methyltransferase